MPGTTRAPVSLNHRGNELNPTEWSIKKEVLAGSQNHTSNTTKQLQPHQFYRIQSGALLTLLLLQRLASYGTRPRFFKIGMGMGVVGALVR